MIVDLTQTIHENMHVFEKRIKPVIIPWSRMDIHGYELELIFMSTHTGTHIDAPYHFNPHGMKVDEIPPDILLLDALLLNIRRDAKEYITREDIESKFDYADAIVIHTHWEEHLEDTDYLNSNPGLSTDAAEYLASKNIRLVGIDTANIDHPSNKNFEAHHILSKKGILIVENLCNLRSVNKRFKLVVAPLKIRGASGSPVRALAIF
ncbi:MAG: cyclase family protein [Candidatus Nitrosocaldaceae archaeon]